MSSGHIITYVEGVRLAQFLCGAWRGCSVVGSIRRREDPRDIDLVAPAVECKPNDPEGDGLFAAINARMTNPWQPATDASLLFRDADATQGATWGTAVRGLKPGFLAAELRLRLKTGSEIPVQIYRYRADNMGWVMIQRTGPREFGVAFLTRWKRRFGIPAGSPDHAASRDGHLVDSYGVVVPVPTEQIAFQKAGMDYVLPERRREYLRRLELSRHLLRD